MSDDIDLDDMDDFDDFDDFGDFDGSSSVVDDRQPITKLADGVSSSLSQAFTDPNQVKRHLSKAVPSEFTPAIDKTSEVASTAVSLYNDTLKAAQPGIKRAKGLVRDNMELVDKYMPKNMAAWVREKTKKEESYQEESKEAIETMAIESAMADVFATKSDSANAEIDTAYREMGAASDEARNHLLDAMRNNLSRMAGFNESVMSQYIKKSLELKYRHYYVSRDHLALFKESLNETFELLRAIAKNTGLPEEVKRRTSEFMVDTIQARMFENMADTIGSYRSQFFGRIRAKAGAALAEKAGMFNDMMETASDMAEQRRDMAEMGIGADNTEQLGGMVGDVAVENISDRAMGWLAKKIGENPKAKKLMDDAGYYSENMESTLLKWKMSESDDGIAGKLSDILKDLIPEFQKATLQSIDFTDKSDAIDKRDELKFRSLTQIIPEHLSNIRLALDKLSGDANAERYVFDPVRNIMVRESEMNSAVDRQIIDRNGIANMSTTIKAALEDIEKSTGQSMTDGMRAALKEQLLRDSINGLTFDTERYSDASTYNKSIDENTRTDIARYMREAFYKEDSIGEDGETKSVYNDTAENSALRRKLAKVADNLNPTGGSATDKIQTLSNFGYGDSLSRAGLTKYDAQSKKQVVDNELLIQRMLALSSDYEDVGEFEHKDTSKMSKKEKKAYGLALKEYKLKVEAVSDGTAIEEIPVIVEESDSWVDKAKSGFDIAKAKLGLRQEEPKLAPRPTYSARTDNGSSNQDRQLSSLQRALEGLNRTLSKQSLGGEDNAPHLESMVEKLTTLQQTNEAGFQAVTDAITAGMIVNADPTGEKITIASVLGKTVRSGAEGLGKLNGLLMKGSMKAAGLITGTAKNAIKLAKRGVTGTYDAAAGLVRGDVYLEGSDRPIITARDFKLGRLIDVKSGMVIRSIKDITGQVIDVNTGEIVLTEEQASQNFKVIGPLGKVMDKGQSLLGNVLDGVNAAKDFLLSKINPESLANVKEVFSRDGKDPLLKAAKLKARKYYDVTTGKIVETINDIKGSVIDTETGETVLTDEEYKAGLREGRESTLLNKIVDLGTGGFQVAFSAFDRIRSALGHKDNGSMDDTEDVYVGNEKTPRILAYLMKAGEYLDEHGKPIMHLRDIKGKVYKDGKLVMDMASGIKPYIIRNGRRVDFEKIGTSMKSGAEWLKDKVVSGANTAIQGAMDMNRMVFDTVKNGVGALSGKLKGFSMPQVGALTVNEDIRDSLHTLRDIYALLQKWDEAGIDRVYFPKDPDKPLDDGPLSPDDVIHLKGDDEGMSEEPPVTKADVIKAVIRNKITVKKRLINGEVPPDDPIVPEGLTVRKLWTSFSGEPMPEPREPAKFDDIPAPVKEHNRNPYKGKLKVRKLSVHFPHRTPKPVEDDVLPVDGSDVDLSTFDAVGKIDRMMAMVKEQYRERIARAILEGEETDDIRNVIDHMPEGPERTILEESRQKDLVTTPGEAVAVLRDIPDAMTLAKKAKRKLFSKAKDIKASLLTKYAPASLDAADDIYALDPNIAESIQEDIELIEQGDSKQSILERIKAILLKTGKFTEEQLESAIARIRSHKDATFKYLKSIEQDLMSSETAQKASKKLVSLFEDTYEGSKEALTNVRTFLTDTEARKEDIRTARLKTRENVDKARAKVNLMLNDPEARKAEVERLKQAAMDKKDSVVETLDGAKTAIKENEHVRSTVKAATDARDAVLANEYVVDMRERAGNIKDAINDDERVAFLKEFAKVRKAAMQEGFSKASAFAFSFGKAKSDEKEEESVRKGSYEDQLQQEKEQAKVDREEQQITVFQRLAAALESKSENDGEKSPGFLAKLAGMFGGGKGGDGISIGGGTSISLGGGDKPGPKGKGRMARMGNALKRSRAGRIAGGAGRMLGRIPGAGIAGRVLKGAAGAVGTVGRVALGGLGMMGSIGTVAGLVGKGALAVGGGLLTALSSPVVLGGLAVGAAGYGAYKLYKHFNKPPADFTGLDEIRAAQYGLDFTEGDNRKKIVALEEALSNKVKDVEGNPSLDLQAEDIESYYQLFGVDKSNEGEVQRANDWFMNRFRPTYLKHRHGLKSKSTVKDLTPEEQRAYLTATKVEAETERFDSMIAPPGLRLINTKRNAMQKWSEISSKVLETDKTPTEGGFGGKAATAAAAAAMAGSGGDTKGHTAAVVAGATTVASQIEKDKEASKLNRTVRDDLRSQQTADAINMTAATHYEQVSRSEEGLENTYGILSAQYEIQTKMFDELVMIKHALILERGLEEEAVVESVETAAPQSRSNARRTRRNINVKG